MNFKPLTFCRLLITWATWLCLLATSEVYAVQAEEDALKAAFIYNFSLFTTWPQLNETINFCVISDNAKFDALNQYEGRKVSDATVHVKKIDSTEEAHTCEVLFIKLNNSTRANQLYDDLAGVPVLTVAEYNTFSQPAAIILFVQSDNRIAFEINHVVATEAKLSLSYKLLRLARKVKMTTP